MPSRSVPGLQTLARMYGVQTSFRAVDGRRQPAPPQTLLHVLRALGAPIQSFADVHDAVRQRWRQLWSRGVEPVTVAWQGSPDGVALRLPAQAAEAPILCHLALESGELRRWTCEAPDLSVDGSTVIGGTRYQSVRLPLPVDLPSGYHRLAFQVGGKQFETLVISAPLKAYSRPEEGRTWGVFLPLYALRTRRSWGVGDLTELASLTNWTAQVGGRTVTTLPLLAAFLDELFAPSPYTPASRLYWNELYVDVTSIPDVRNCPPAQAILGSQEFQQGVAAQRSRLLVDYRVIMALKRRVMEELAQCFFAKRSKRYGDFARFRDGDPSLEGYARFRAVGERLRVPWPEWPQPLRDGLIRPGDYDETTERYHMYVQWIAQEQLDALSRTARRKGVHLGLDLPLGAHPDGYDVWRERSLFVRGVAAGAPPDTFFAKGQNWGFHPPKPEEQRYQGYRHLIACLRHHLRYASTLRIDHVMGLHRLYWIPKGTEARDGAYVRYPAEELYAILSLESHRHGAVIVGEDLGTVPGYVRRIMRRHGLQRSYVVQIDETTSPERPLGSIPSASVASLNTHDTPTFSAYWRDLHKEFKQGLLSALRRKGLSKGRLDDDQSVLRALLGHLAAGPARTVLINLEDLWLETNPQNVPGTTDEHPNWRRRARYTLEEFSGMSQVLQVIQEVDRLRKRKKGHVAAQ